VAFQSTTVEHGPIMLGDRLQWGWEGDGCLLIKSSRSKHQCVRDLAPPTLKLALQRSQLSVRIHAGALTLQPLKQLARCPPRLGLEPPAHLGAVAQIGLRLSWPYPEDRVSWSERRLAWQCGSCG